ncbi:MAG: RNA-binding protein [Chloroflexi bacterium]|nr:RNA-binding protein [Chloroflexota bacterium]
MGTRLYVGNLPYTASEDEIRRLFEQAGNVDSVYLPTDRQTGQPRGFGFVEMTNSSDAENAIRMYDGYTIGGRQIRVNQAREREDRGGYGGGRR